MADAAFNRILLKISGEALMGDLAYGTDPAQIERIANQVREVRAQEGEVAIVVGAGNIYRGLEERPRAWTARPPTTWDARDGPERADAAGRAGEGRSRHPRPLRDGGHRGRRAVHPPQGDPATSRRAAP